MIKPIKHASWYLLLGGVAVLCAVAGFMLQHWLADIAWQQRIEQQGLANLKVPEIRPEFELPDLHNQLQNITNWDGKIIVLNFWATWCPPCLKEIPVLMAAQQKYAARNVQFIGVALDEMEAVQTFANRYQINYPILLDSLLSGLSLQYGNRLSALPYTVVIDTTGKLVSTHYQALSAEQVDQLLAPLL